MSWSGGTDLTSCPLIASLEYFKDNAWQVYPFSPPIYFSTTSTSVLTDIGKYHFEVTDASSYNPSKTYRMRITIANQLFATTPATGSQVEFEFNLTIEYQCSKLLITGSSSPIGDISLVIGPTLNTASVSLASTNVLKSIASCAVNYKAAQV